jgi:hypothetical protein
MRSIATKMEGQRFPPSIDQISAGFDTAKPGSIAAAGQLLALRSGNEELKRRKDSPDR